MTLKEVSINAYEDETEQREKREFEIYFNGFLKLHNRDDKEYRMDGFKRKLVESHDDILIFDERPNIIVRQTKPRWKGDKVDKNWYAATSMNGTAAHAWDTWQARARLGIQMESERTPPQESMASIRTPAGRQK